MAEKNTDELEKLLKNTRIGDAPGFLAENRESMLDAERGFYDHIKKTTQKNGLLLQKVFLDADIPERYGYKLISGEKHTKQRDIILRICYAAGMSLEETQHALALYGMPQLYARLSRDAVLMICFNERPGSILDVNEYLKKNKLIPLRTSGVQE